MLLLITVFCLHVRNTRTVQVHKLRLLRAYSTHAGREANSALRLFTVHLPARTFSARRHKAVKSDREARLIAHFQSVLSGSARHGLEISSSFYFSNAIRNIA